MANMTIKEGDCVANVAFDNGFDIDKIWSHGENARLRQNRSSPHVLLRGDTLVVPEKETSEESGATEQKHRFRIHLMPVKLRLRLLRAGDPLADEVYQLSIEGLVVEGRTNGDGVLEETISPTAKSGLLTIDEDEYHLQIGSLDPETEIPGVQARLNNLGYPCGEVDGVLNDETIDALMLFQETYELEITGETDEATQAKLKELHGC